jgi:hypothetical protein
MTEPKSHLEHALFILGGHLYALSTDMLQDPNDGSPRPTRFGLSLGTTEDRAVVRVIVDIRPHAGPHSSWEPITAEEAAAPALTVEKEAPRTVVANVWDHVVIYDGLDPKGTMTRLGPRGPVLYSGNRVGACTFFAQHCAAALAMAYEKDVAESKKKK